jgi:molecular chaperone DnaK
MASRLSDLLKMSGVDFLESPLRRAVGASPDQLADDRWYVENVADFAWLAAPPALRVLGRRGLAWDDELLRLREVVFETVGNTVSLRDDWKKKIEESSPAVKPVGQTSKPKDQSSPIAVGIDLGTTYSVVAYIDSAGRPTTIVNSNGELLTPSVVLFDEGGPIVGAEAVKAAALEPGLVAECVKRDMGKPEYRKPIGGQTYRPEVISSIILKKLRTDAERKLGPVKKVVVTVPAYFDEPRRQATIAAARMAGLDTLDLMNEPTAAAIAFGHQEGLLTKTGEPTGDKPLQVLVYDLGGGTFDVTIVRIEPSDFRVVATDGDVTLGGKDWDERLIAILAERFKTQHRSDPRESPESLQELQQVAEQTKKSLSERQKAIAYVNHLGKRAKIEVTREEFESATAALLGRTRTTTEIVILQAGLTWKDIDRVLLVGGSTRMPQVERMLRDLTGKKPDRSLSPDEAVAHGAALYADLLLKKHGLGGAGEFEVTNVNSHSLGIVAIEKGSNRKVNRILIPKNTPLPYAVRSKFKTYKDNQRTIGVRVLEGESELPEACTQVGECVIRDLPPNLPAGWPIQVVYKYSEDGRLKVKAELVGHGAATSSEFVRDNSLPDDDLLLWAQMLEAVEDQG